MSQISNVVGVVADLSEQAVRVRIATASGLADVGSTGDHVEEMGYDAGCEKRAHGPCSRALAKA